MTFSGSPLGPTGTRGPDAVIGLARARAQELDAGRGGGPDPDRRSGGGCRRPLVILGRALLGFVLLGWVLTLITNATQS